MAVRTPTPPGPPPRGFRWPGQEPSWPPGPLGDVAATPQSSGGKHGVAVFVGIVALVVGIVIGYLLGSGDDDAEGSLATGSPVPEASTATPSTAPPTSAGTAPGSGGSSGPLGTSDNPVPTGQSWILGVLELEVVETDFDAAEEILSADRSNAAPPEGSVDVLVRIRVSLLEDIFVFATDYVPWLEDAGGNRYFPDSHSCGPVIPDDFHDQGAFHRRGPLEGNLCFQVPGDTVEGLRLGTEGVDDQTTYFRLG